MKTEKMKTEKMERKIKYVLCKCTNREMIKTVNGCSNKNNLKVEEYLCDNCRNKIAIMFY